MIDEICVAVTCGMKKYENSSKGQSSRSYVTNFQLLLAFTMEHIPTKLHQLPVSSFRDSVRTDAQTDTQTDRKTPPKAIPARSTAKAQVIINAHFKT